MRRGIGASTVLTRRGADIVVPNSQPVTERVTNWTLSNQLKRIDLPVGISYYDAVHAAGMVFPFPQREVRLLTATVNDDSPAQGLASDATVVGPNGRTV